MKFTYTQKARARKPRPCKGSSANGGSHETRDYPGWCNSSALKKWAVIIKNYKELIVI